MNAIKVIGIDLAKSFFQVCVWMSDIHDTRSVLHWAHKRDDALGIRSA
ncbi:hypothetical protein PCO85_04800 [Prodigiosinella aquatilis]|nr:hypothetical protein [Prodigiosinella sp. LS101]WJV54757.1 hypothetical protein PCO85_04800 [Prodigiosinella sp. LS101]WJV59121.1 hypothetical protein PCO84_04815 [Pectobacteriaceae bacterium C111]